MKLFVRASLRTGEWVAVGTWPSLVWIGSSGATDIKIKIMIVTHCLDRCDY